MFERFTDPARQVCIHAREEARALKHHHIGIEHLLLGLLGEQDGLAARVLGSFGVSIEEVRGQVVRIVGEEDEVVPFDEIPFTPRAKKVLELALREALSLGHNYIGTEHILLAVVREKDSVAYQILRDSHADPDKIRDEIVRMIASPGIRVVIAGHVEVALSDGTKLIVENADESDVMAKLSSRSGPMGAAVLDARDGTYHVLPEHVVYVRSVPDSLPEDA